MSDQPASVSGETHGGICEICGADWVAPVGVPGHGSALHPCPEDGPCACGHKFAFCHRLNAQTYCPDPLRASLTDFIDKLREDADEHDAKATEMGHARGWGHVAGKHRREAETKRRIADDLSNLVPKVNS